MESEDRLTLEQKLAQKEKELEIILAIDRIRDATVEPHSMLSAIINVVVGEMEADLGLVSWVDEETGALELKAVDDRVGVFRHLEQAVVQRLMEQATALGGISSMECPPELQAQGLPHLLAAPLTMGGQQLGALVLLKEEDGFSQADVDLLEAVVSQADSAVVHARTYGRLQQRNKELEVIYRVDRVRDSGLDFDSMLNAVLNELCQAIETEMGFIMLFDRTGQQLELKASTGGNIFAMAEHYHLVEETAEEALYLGGLVNRSALSAEIHSLICVPLVLHKEIIGVFGAVNRRGLEGFGREDERLLLAITSQVDTAIFESLERQRIRSTFSRYVSPKVVDLMLKTDHDFLKVDRAFLTVLFSDMRGFTSVTERTAPNTLMSFLNEHLAAMTEVIDRHEGTVDKFVGDEVVALFGAPMPMEDHARRAVCTALEMQQAHQELMAGWVKAGHEAVPIGIGINTGEMIVGNIGCQRQMDYTAIGDNMNLASRICGVARGGQVLISQATYQLVRQDVVVHELAPVRVKGKAQPVQLYEVVALV